MLGAKLACPKEFPVARKVGRERCCLLQVVLQFPAAGRMTQFAQCLSFDLPDSLSGYLELLAHLF